MRILNETEMSVAAGGVLPLPWPEAEPDIRPDYEDGYRLRLFWIQPEICGDPWHEGPCN